MDHYLPRIPIIKLGTGLYARRPFCTKGHFYTEGFFARRVIFAREHKRH